MVRGNWQKRVERTEARRQDAKARKQRTEDRRKHKASGSRLLSALARLRGSDETLKIEFWMDGSLGGSVGGKPRSESLGNEYDNVVDDDAEDDDDDDPKKKRGGAKKKFQGPGKKKKKAHPRSKEDPAHEADDIVAAEVKYLCRPSFFGGKCHDFRGGKKGTACRRIHFGKKELTLENVVKDKSVLKQADEAFPTVTEDDSDLGRSESAMHLLVHVKVQDGPETQDFLERISEDGYSAADIVFVTVGHTLVYDRYQDGLIVDENNMLGQEKSLTTNCSKEKDLYISAPGLVLEHILTFLPDVATRNMRLVCKAWNREIGNSSIFLWQHLLQRHNWPLPQVNRRSVSVGSYVEVEYDEDDQKEEIQNYRGAFYSHYLASREMRALCSGIDDLLHQKRSISDREYHINSFDSRRDSPQARNECVSMCVWSPNRILAAFSSDCSLRLFGSVRKSANTSEMTSRELVCHRIALNTKRDTCHLLAMDVDDELIGCICNRVSRSNQNVESCVLVAVKREDFLVADSLAEEGHILLTDMKQATINYVLCCEDLDSEMIRLKDYLVDDESIEKLQMSPSGCMAACGYGRFLTDISIFAPSPDGDPDNRVLLLHKLVLFSVEAGVVSWMSPGSLDLSAADTLVSCRWRSIDGPLLNTTFASVGCDDSSFLVGSIEGADIDFRRNPLPELPHFAGWHKHPLFRPIVIAETGLIMATNVASPHDNEEDDGTGIRDLKSVLSFYSHGGSLEGDPVSCSLVLKGKMIVDSLEKLGTRHIVALARVYRSRLSTTQEDSAYGNGIVDANDGDIGLGGGADDGVGDNNAGADADGEEEDEEVDVGNLVGQWFQPPERGRMQIFAIVIDTATKREISRHCIIPDIGVYLDRDLSPVAFSCMPPPIRLSADANADTVAASVWWKGVVSTGHAVRDAGRNLPQPSSVSSPNGKQATSSAKKKKPKTGGKKDKSGGKKDGFARGMSMRG